MHIYIYIIYIYIYAYIYILYIYIYISKYPKKLQKNLMLPSCEITLPTMHHLVIVTENKSVLVMNDQRHQVFVIA